MTPFRLLFFLFLGITLTTSFTASSLTALTYSSSSSSSSSFKMPFSPYRNRTPCPLFAAELPPPNVTPPNPHLLPPTPTTPPTTNKFHNALILSLSFSIIIHSVIAVDADLTRGWTLTEQLYRLPYDNWRNYEESLADSPVSTKTAINVVIYLLGDWLSQTVFKGGNVLEFDAGRTVKNGCIGAAFGPCVHLYYEWSDQILPVEVSARMSRRAT